VTTAATAVAPPAAAARTAPVLDVVVPVHNEEADLEPCVRRLHGYLRAAFPYPYRITVADNASTDGTPGVAARLAAELPGVAVLTVPAKGRGGALRTAWTASDADVLAYLDVDLSTDLAALAPLVAPLLSGHSDVAIGSRLTRGARVVRGPKREVLSRGYNLLLRGALAARFSDAQCGFKAIRRDVARQVLPLVRDTGWFFDTELLVIAQRAGLRIHEVPVDWVDDPDSRVDLLPTIVADLRGIARLARDLATGTELRATLGRTPATAGLAVQLLRFAAIGVVSTVVHLGLFALLAGPLGAQPANGAALLLAAVANTAANRRLTFGVTGPRHRGRHQAQGLVVFGLGWALTGGALALVPDAARGVQLTVLIVANATATLLRFLLMRNWIFRRR